jgi:hypothetical protein
MFLQLRRPLWAPGQRTKTSLVPSAIQPGLLVVVVGDFTAETAEFLSPIVQRRRIAGKTWTFLIETTTIRTLL